ncbi:hypothetical protein CHI08_01425 [Peribacillus simplex]|nr:hypothetical protein CHI08_01425 [Peribacillus simplex]
MIMIRSACMITLDQLVPACKMEIKEGYVHILQIHLCGSFIFITVYRSKDHQKVVTLHIWQE